MRSFRHQLVLAADVDLATCVSTCDNGFEIYVNGKKIGVGDNWADPKSFDLSSALQRGLLAEYCRSILPGERLTQWRKRHD